MRIVEACLCLLPLVSWVSPALAADATDSLVLLVEPETPALARRLREEIESLGLDVALVAEQEPPQPLDERARASGALAAIRVTTSGTGAVEMTIVDRATGKTVSRRLAISTPNDPAAAELIATRTVELLRASLMELAAPHPPRGEVAVTAEVEALAPVAAPPPWGTLSVGAGPAFVYEPDFGASTDVWVSLSLLTRARLGVTAQLFVPLEQQRLEAREGQVELLVTQYRLGAMFEAQAPESPLSARFHAGLLLAHLDVSAAAGLPYYAEEDDLVAWGPWLGAAARVAFGAHVGAVAGAEASLGFPRTVIRFAGREVATWGRPAATGRVGLELSWR